MCDNKKRSCPAAGCVGMRLGHSYHSSMRRSFRWILLALLVPFAALALYVLAALVGALVPRNAGWQEPPEGVLIWVRTNGVHADVVLPAQASGVDWYALLPPAHIPEPALAQGWVGIGWGQREFYLHTPTWADLTVRTAVRALAGGETLMHVTHLPRPSPNRWYRPVRVEPERYRRLAIAIAADFERDAAGQPIPLIGAGYSEYDVFYEAHGSYHAFRTSNQWTGEMLAIAGVTIGVWTPFEQSILWRFPVRSAGFVADSLEVHAVRIDDER
jgi:uncharacterized protein (TIGR02117 family)